MTHKLCCVSQFLINYKVSNYCLWPINTYKIWRKLYNSNPHHRIFKIILFIFICGNLLKSFYRERVYSQTVAGKVLWPKTFSLRDRDSLAGRVRKTVSTNLLCYICTLHVKSGHGRFQWTHSVSVKGTTALAAYQLRGWSSKNVLMCWQRQSRISVAVLNRVDKWRTLLVYHVGPSVFQVVKLALDLTLKLF